jgi:DNA-directed RNA polymerase subunit RPC12/RpoP
MARYNQNGGTIATTLFEVAAYQHTLKASCPRCGHDAVFSGHALWWLFQRKHWGDHLDQVRERLKCTRCGRKDVRITVGYEAPTITSLPMPQEGEWKRAVSRYRS